MWPCFLEPVPLVGRKDGNPPLTPRYLSDHPANLSQYLSGIEGDQVLGGWVGGWGVNFASQELKMRR